MEKALKEFYATYTELEVIQIVLGGQIYRSEKLAKERESLTQATSIDETCLQQNKDMTDFVQKSIEHYEKELRLQKKNQ